MIRLARCFPYWKWYYSIEKCWITTAHLSFLDYFPVKPSIYIYIYVCFPYRPMKSPFLTGISHLPMGCPAFFATMSKMLRKRWEQRWRQALSTRKDMFSAHSCGFFPVLSGAHAARSWYSRYLAVLSVSMGLTTQWFFFMGYDFW